jgi:REP element-mobilizing transposase RayT
MSHDLPNRHTIRLPGYDYSQSGIYFVTICTQNRECILGDIVDGKMILNETGQILTPIWESLPKRFSIVLDEFQIMPNHVHMIIQINHFRTDMNHQIINDIAIAKSHRHMGLMNQTPTLGHVVRYFKSKCTYEIHKIGFNNYVWQHNYYEHIVRNEDDLNKIREYVNINPLIWDRDRNNPESL